MRARSDDAVILSTTVSRITRTAVLACLGVFLAAVVAGGASAQSERVSAYPPDAKELDPRGALEVSQAAIGRTVRDVALRDSKGRNMRLSDLRGKPLLITFVYTACAQSCPIITAAMADAVDVGREALGDNSFNILTVGFDTAQDTPERLRAFASRYGENLPGWYFVTGSLPDILSLVDDLGFVYFRTAKGFDHLDQVSILDQDGVVYGQVYGADFDPPILVEPLKSLVYGTATPFASIDDLINKVKLFCTLYDPVTGRYYFDYSYLIHIIVGSTMLLGMGIFVIRNGTRLIRDRRRRKLTPVKAQPPAHRA